MDVAPTVGTAAARSSAALALTGPGSVSVDNVLGLDWSTASSVGGVALGVDAAIATLLLRRPPAPTVELSTPTTVRERAA